MGKLILLVSILLCLVCTGIGQVVYSQLDGQAGQGFFTVNATAFTHLQIADDITVPPGFFWNITGALFRGFFNRNCNAALFSGFTLQVFDNIQVADPNNPPNLMNVPGTEIRRISLSVTLPFTVLNATTTLDFFPTFVINPPLILNPGRYWVSPWITFGGAVAASWAALMRNVSASGIVARGEIWRRKDSNNFLNTGFTNEWVKGNTSAFGDSGELLFNVLGAQTVLPTTTGISVPSSPVANPPNPESSSIIPIAAGAAGGGLALILIIVVIVLAVFLARRNRQAKQAVNSQLEDTHNSIRPGSYNATVDPQSAFPLPPQHSTVNANFNPGGNYKAITPSPSENPNPFTKGTVNSNLPTDVYSSIEMDGKKNLSFNVTGDKSYLIVYKELAFVQEVGSGAYGVVYKGTWRGSSVAIKQIATKVTTVEMESFKAEAKLMASLRPHSNVVQFLGASFSEDSRMCLVTEFMDGGSLFAMLHSGSKLDANMVQNFARGIAAGMLHLHSENIIHRDLASRNVLLSANAVKIADFGMSRVLAESNQKSNQTKSNTGPLKWMPPESIKKREYSTFSDVWAFGVTLWEILCRQEPFPELDAVQAAIEVTNGTRLTFPEFTPVILKKITTQCFQLVPENRGGFQDICDQFAKAPLSEWFPVIKK